MPEILSIVAIVLLLVVIGLLVVLLLRKSSVDLSPLQQALQATDKVGERAEQAVRDDIVRTEPKLRTSASNPVKNCTIS